MRCKVHLRHVSNMLWSDIIIFKILQYFLNSHRMCSYTNRLYYLSKYGMQFVLLNGYEWFMQFIIIIKSLTACRSITFT